MRENYAKYSRPVPQKEAEENKVKMGEVNCQSLYVRKKPEVSPDNILGVLFHKDVVQILSEEEGLDGLEKFLKIRRISDGLTGYAMKQYILRK